MKKGQKHAAKPAHAAPTIPPHIAALEIVKSVRADGSYVCIHDQELMECDECAPIALLADEEASGPAAPTIAIECEPPALDAPDAPPAVAFASDRTVGTLDETEYFPTPEVRPVLVFDESLSVACAALGLAGEPLPPFDPTIERIGEPITDATVEAYGGDRTVVQDMLAEDDLSVACAALGLASEHVRKHTSLDAGRIRILTHGGTSITWPDDRDKYTARPLTQAQKDGVVTSTAHVVDSLRKASEAASEAARKLKAE